VVVLGHSASATVTNVVSSTLSVTDSLGVPNSTTANAQVLDTFGNDVSATRMVTWTSSDPSTVTVSAAGPVTAATQVTFTAVTTNSSSVTITVSAVDNTAVNNSATLTVNP